MGRNAYLHAVSHILRLEHDLPKRPHPLIPIRRRLRRQLDRLLRRAQPYILVPRRLTSDRVPQIHDTMREVRVLNDGISGMARFQTPRRAYRRGLVPRQNIILERKPVSDPPLCPRRTLAQPP